jgi:hypothetical protein
MGTIDGSAFPDTVCLTPSKLQSTERSKKISGSKRIMAAQFQI